MTLRELRMWHWRRLLVCRAGERKHEAELASDQSRNRSYHEQRLRYARQNADFHLKAVQALNMVCQGTAEQDCSMVDNPTNNRS